MLRRCRSSSIRRPPELGSRGSRAGALSRGARSRSGARRAHRRRRRHASSASSASRRARAWAARSPPSARSPDRWRATLAPAFAPELTGSQRLALIRAAIAQVGPRRLRRSASRPGFAPALDALIAELQAALVSPEEFARIVAELDEPGYESELAALYARLRRAPRAGGRGDSATTLAAADRRTASGPRGLGRAARCPLRIRRPHPGAARARRRPRSRRARSRSRSHSPTAGRSPRGPSCSRGCEQELGATRSRSSPTTTATPPAPRCATSIAACSSPAPARSSPTTASCCWSAPASAARRRRSESRSPACSTAARARRDRRRRSPSSELRPAAGQRPARARGPGRAGGVDAARRDRGRRLADRPLPRGRRTRPRSTPCSPTCGSIRRCRRARRHGRAADPPRRRRRRSTAATDQLEDPAARTWRGCARPATTPRGCGRSPRSARELAEGAHRKQAPLVRPGRPRGALLGGRAARRGRGRGAARGAGDVGRLPGCEQPGLAAAVEALESASVRAWRGPAEGRVRILSPYRRAGGAGAGAVRRLAAGRRVPERGAPRPAARRGAPPRDRQPRPAPRRPGRRGALPLPRLRLAPDRAPLPELAELRRGRHRARPLAVRRRGPRPARPRSRRGRAAAHANPRTRARRWSRPPRRPASASSPGRSRSAAGSADRGAVLERARRRRSRPPRSRRSFDGPTTRTPLPGPLRVPAVLEDARRRATSSARARSRAGSPARTSGSSSTSCAAAPGARGRPAVAGRVVHAALDRLYREPPGEDAIPRPGDVGRWRERFAELLDAGGRRARAGRRQSLPPRWRSRAPAIQVEAFLEAEAESDSELRPRPDLLERGFGPSTRTSTSDEPRRRCDSASSPCAAGSTGSTSTPAGAARSSATTRPASRCPARTRSPTRARCRSSSTCWSPQRVLGLEPIGGLYQPLGAVGPTTARPRGLVAEEDERLDGLELVRTATTARRRSSSGALEQAEASAERAAGEMRARRDRPRPARRQVPEVLHLPADLPARARARRGRRAERRRGAMTADEGQLAFTGLEPPSRSPSRRPSAEVAARSRRRPASSPPPSRRRRSPRATATSSSRRAPAAARRASSSIATATRSPTTASRSTRSSPSPSPSAPRPSCARGSGASSSPARARRATAGDACARRRAAAGSRGRPSAPG